MGRINTQHELKEWHTHAIRLALLLGLISLWEVSVRTGLIDKFYFSSPFLIVSNLTDWWSNGLLIHHLSVTLAEAFVGLGVGLFLGVFFGYIFASNPLFDSILQPFFVILNALPRIAFAPLIILWFGLGFLSKVVIVVSLVFFIVFFNSYRGFKDVNPIILKNADVLGATKWIKFRHIYFPSALMWIFASLRTSVGFAMIGAILGEYIGASAGIGYLIDNAQSNFDATGVISGLIVITLVVALLDSILQKVEQKFTPWRTHQIQTNINTFKVRKS